MQTKVEKKYIFSSRGPISDKSLIAGDDGLPVAAQSCQTSFLAAAQATQGLDFLVQAIQRGNLADVLPAAGSGATVFAPNNDAFTNMLQTLSARPSFLHP